MKNLTYNRRAAITFHSLFRYIHSKGKKKLSRFKNKKELKQIK